MAHTGQKVNHLYLKLYFINENKLRRARFRARGGLLNIADMCICARGLFPRGRHAHGNSQRAFTRSLPSSPLSLLPSPSPLSSPLLLSLLLLAAPCIAAAAHTHTRTHTHTRSPRPALPSPLPPALASAPRLLRRARVRARFVAVFFLSWL